MSTIREYLDGCKFDWDAGRIAISDTGDDLAYPGWSDGHNTRLIQNDDIILDHNFDGGFGGPECPRYVAQDKNGTYFPSQYDGSTGGEVVHSVDWYLKNPDEQTPYPGG